MATIKRGRKPKEETPEAPKEAQPIQETPPVIDETPKPAEPVIVEAAAPKPVEPVIRVLQPRAMPNTSQPVKTPVASGNVLLCDRKSGRCLSVSASYAAQITRYDKNKYIKK